MQHSHEVPFNMNIFHKAIYIYYQSKQFFFIKYIKASSLFQELRLDRNRLNAVPSASLSGPKALRSLTLSSNRISKLPFFSETMRFSYYLIDLFLLKELSANVLNTLVKIGDRSCVSKYYKNSYSRLKEAIENHIAGCRKRRKSQSRAIRSDKKL